MEVQYRSADGRMLFKLNGGNHKDLFEQIAEVQEVFECETRCGCCAGMDRDGGTYGIRFRVRRVQKYVYYELHCQNPYCRARFAFGQNQEGGTLFPKRRDAEGNYLSNRGWTVYKPDKETAA